MRFFRVSSSAALLVHLHNKNDGFRIGFVMHWRNGFRRSNSRGKQALSAQRIINGYVDVDQWKRKSELAEK
jgi:hypothetical protein